MTEEPILQTRDLHLHYGSFHALKNVRLTVQPRRITAIIGPSGCGKSTLLRVFNRMNDLVDGARVDGQVLFHGQDILSPATDLLRLRRSIGMVFQRPNPFPLSIFENVVFGLKIHPDQRRDPGHLRATVQRCLEAVLLWDDLKDRLDRLATNLSLEQQQKLCIARLLAVQPEVLLMDEPCSALDPMSTQRIEELMLELKKQYTIIIVTHNMQQAARVSDDTGYMLLGEMIEFGRTEKIFTNPDDKQTEDYITGKLG